MSDQVQRPKPAKMRTLFELEDLEETKDRLLLNELRRDKDGDGKYISETTWTLDFVQGWRNVASNP